MTGQHASAAGISLMRQQQAAAGSGCEASQPRSTAEESSRPSRGEYAQPYIILQYSTRYPYGWYSQLYSYSVPVIVHAPTS